MFYVAEKFFFFFFFFFLSWKTFHNAKHEASSKTSSFARTINSHSYKIHVSRTSIEKYHCMYSVCKSIGS